MDVRCSTTNTTTDADEDEDLDSTVPSPYFANHERASASTSTEEFDAKENEEPNFRKNEGNGHFSVSETGAVAPTCPVSLHEIWHVDEDEDGTHWEFVVAVRGPTATTIFSPVASTVVLSPQEFRMVPKRTPDVATVSDCLPLHPMIVGDVDVVRMFLGEAIDGTRALDVVLWFVFGSEKRVHLKNVLVRMLDDGSLVWWTPTEFTFVAGGVVGSVHEKQLVMWDEFNHTTRRDRNGKESVFCDPSPSGRFARNEWSTSWPRILHVESVAWSFETKKPEADTRPVRRMLDFVTVRHGRFREWLASDAEFAASDGAREEETETKIVREAEEALPEIKRRNDRVLWKFYHDYLLREYMRDSSLIQHLQKRVREVKVNEQAEDEDTAVSIVRMRVRGKFRDDLSMRHTTEGKAAINTRRRALIRQYRTTARKRLWPF